MFRRTSSSKRTAAGRTALQLVAGRLSGSPVDDQVVVKSTGHEMPPRLEATGRHKRQKGAFWVSCRTVLRLSRPT